MYSEDSIISEDNVSYLANNEASLGRHRSTLKTQTSSFFPACFILYCFCRNRDSLKDQIQTLQHKLVTKEIEYRKVDGQYQLIVAGRDEIDDLQQ